jgi:hypothetical protein
MSETPVVQKSPNYRKTMPVAVSWEEGDFLFFAVVNRYFGNNPNDMFYEVERIWIVSRKDGSEPKFEAEAPINLEYYALILAKNMAEDRFRVSLQPPL